MKVPEPRKLKSGSYFIQLRLDGVSVPVTASTARECRRQAELIKAEHRSGKRAVSSKQSLTLDKAIEAYIDSRRAVLSPSTVRGYEMIRNHRFQSVANSRIGDINWQIAINTESRLCSPKTLKNAYSLMVSVLDFCDIRPQNVQLPQIIQPEKAWLEPEQIPVFVEAVAKESFAIPALLALHGLRRSEIFALDWNAVDLDRRTVTVAASVVVDEHGEYVRKSEAKNITSRRTVPIMIPALYDLLMQAKGEGRPVITGTPNALYRQVNRVCARCGLPSAGVHGLRHSFASLGYHLGIPEREMMELGGWSNTATMHGIYTHIAQSDRMKTRNKIADFFKNANENAND